MGIAHGLAESRQGILVECCCGQLMFHSGGASPAEIIGAHAEPLESSNSENRGFVARLKHLTMKPKEK